MKETKIKNKEQLIKMVAKHYEKCKRIYYDAIAKMKLEESSASLLAVFRAITFETGAQSIECNDLWLLEARDIFKINISCERFAVKGYIKFTGKKDEYGFDCYEIIVPPTEWNLDDAEI